MPHSTTMQSRHKNTAFQVTRAATWCLRLCMQSVELWAVLARTSKCGTDGPDVQEAFQDAAINVLSHITCCKRLYGQPHANEEDQMMRGDI